MNNRLEQDLALLRETVGGRSEIKVGAKTVDRVVYTGVRIKNVRLSSTKFNVTSTDMLFLLPPRYPELPPIGCYLNYKWETVDHHFTLQAHYGAPYLKEGGWYWYCVGLGGGFRETQWQRTWKPAANVADGHNLSTLFVTARLAINQG